MSKTRVALGLALLLTLSVGCDSNPAGLTEVTTSEQHGVQTAHKAASTFDLLSATATNVTLSLGEDEPQLKQILDDNIGSEREVITFDGLAANYLGPGQFDDRLIDQGVRFEGVSGTTQVGGTGDSGSINGDHLNVAPGFTPSRVRVHFVEPGTTNPTTVNAVGGFTTTADKDNNCMDFFDASSVLLGSGCMQSDYYYPTTDVEFLGGASDGGIASVEIYSGVPFEVDLFSFNEPCPELLLEIDGGEVHHVEEGGSVLLSASGTDPINGGIEYAWDLDGDSVFETAGQSVNFAAGGLDGPSTHPVAVQATNACGRTATAGADVEVDNVAPVVASITAPLAPLAAGTGFTADASFTDAGVPDTHTAEWDWGDGTTSAGTVTEIGGSGSISGAHTYATSGIYTVTVTVTDDDGDAGQASFQYVVVYDPSAGFVTGGGWIDSPESAYAANLTLTGRAQFGFVARYRKGQNVPDGRTDFRFKTADLDFQSTSYDWLVVNQHKAMYKGTGTINGSGSYGFQISAIDAAQTPSTDDDLFRIKIWDKNNGDALVYDNQVGETDDTADPTTALGGGNIKIQSNH